MDGPHPTPTEPSLVGPRVLALTMSGGVRLRIWLGDCEVCRSVRLSLALCSDAWRPRRSWRMPWWTSRCARMNASVNVAMESGPAVRSRSWPRSLCGARCKTSRARRGSPTARRSWASRLPRCRHAVCRPSGRSMRRSGPTKVVLMPVLEFDPPDRFVAGTVGPPGQRTFFLQASAGPRLASVSLEKQQLSTLADRVNDLLDDFAAGEAADVVAESFEDVDPLATPIEDEFRVGTMSLGWDGERRGVIAECHDGQEELVVDEEGEPTLEPEQPGVLETVLRVVIQPARARAFARRCTKVVAAGRPPCPTCE